MLQCQHTETNYVSTCKQVITENINKKQYHFIIALKWINLNIDKILH